MLDDDADKQDGRICPYCASDNDCEHLLLLADFTFRTADGGALFEAFGNRWAMVPGPENDVFDESETFVELLEQVDALADTSFGYVVEGGPGITSQYAIYYCSTNERILKAVQAFDRETANH